MTTHPDHPACLEEPALLVHCQLRRSRASGPGGQHRNKVETAVEIVHQPTGVSGSASERRSQEDNRKQALFRLRVNLALQVRGDPPAVLIPSDLWRSRCKGRQLQINPQHTDFPAMLAEALDALAARRLDVKIAATALGCTPSQFIKLLKLEPRALAQLNQTRLARGLHSIH